MDGNVVEQVGSTKFLGVVVDQDINWKTLLNFQTQFDEKLNILSKSRYNVDLILVGYYISAGQTSLLQVQGKVTFIQTYNESLHSIASKYIYIVNGC